jgi:hypothetical protein
MCDRPGGLHPAPGRHVSCHISGAGVVSRPAILCGGSCDGQPNTLLSASPADHTIAPGERDEMSVVSEDRLRAEIAFTRGGVTHTDTSIESPAVEGVATLVIDADDIAARFRRLTGGSAEELTAFTVTLRPTQAGFENRRLVRRYTVDRTPRTGRRLAWINRLGTIDYHTFPVAAEFRSGGSHTLVETSSGPRTVATGATQSLRLLSRPCTASEAEWLSEIFSSPAVWTVDGTGFERVGVAPGEVVCTPLSPTVVSVVISPLSQFSTTSTSL